MTTETVLREIPSCRASARLDGRRWPGASRAPAMAVLNCSYSWRVSNAPGPRSRSIIPDSGSRIGLALHELPNWSFWRGQSRLRARRAGARAFPCADAASGRLADDGGARVRRLDGARCDARPRRAGRQHGADPAHGAAARLLVCWPRTDLVASGARSE